MRDRKEIEGDLSEEFLTGSEEIPSNSVIKSIEIELLLDIRDLLINKESISNKKGCGKYITGDFGGQLCGTMTEFHGLVLCPECQESNFSVPKRNLPIKIEDDLFQAIEYVSVMQDHPALKEMMARIEKILTENLEKSEGNKK